jgi:hypothetical protein
VKKRASAKEEEAATERKRAARRVFFMVANLIEFIVSIISISTGRAISPRPRKDWQIGEKFTGKRVFAASLKERPPARGKFGVYWTQLELISSLSQLNDYPRTPPHSG